MSYQPYGNPPPSQKPRPGEIFYYSEPPPLSYLGNASPQPQNIQANARQSYYNDTKNAFPQSDASSSYHSYKARDPGPTLTSRTSPSRSSPTRRPLPSPINQPRLPPFSLHSSSRPPSTILSGVRSPSPTRPAGSMPFGVSIPLSSSSSGTIPDSSQSHKKPLPRPPSVISPTIAALGSAFTGKSSDSDPGPRPWSPTKDLLPKSPSTGSFPSSSSSRNMGPPIPTSSSDPSFPTTRSRSPFIPPPSPSQNSFTGHFPPVASEPRPGGPNRSYSNRDSAIEVTAISRTTSPSSPTKESGISFVPLWKQRRGMTSVTNQTTAAPARRALPTPLPRTTTSPTRPIQPVESSRRLESNNSMISTASRSSREEPVRSSTLPSPPGYDNPSDFHVSDAKRSIPLSPRIESSMRSPSPQIPPPLPPRPPTLRSHSRAPSPAPSTEVPRGRPESRQLPQPISRASTVPPVDTKLFSPRIPPPELPPRPRSRSRAPSPSPVSPPATRVVSPPLRDRQMVVVLPSSPPSKLESDIASALQALQIGRPVDAPPPPRHPSRPEPRSRGASPAPRSRATSPAPPPVVVVAEEPVTIIIPRETSPSPPPQIIRTATPEPPINHDAEKQAELSTSDTAVTMEIPVPTPIQVVPPVLPRTRPSYTTSLNRPVSSATPKKATPPALAPSTPRSPVRPSFTPTSPREPQSMAMRLAEAALAEERAVERARAASPIRSPVLVQHFDDGEESETDVDEEEGEPEHLPTGVTKPSEKDASSRFVAPVFSIDASDGADGGRREADAYGYDLPTGGTTMRPASPSAPISISIPVPQISFPDMEEEEEDRNVGDAHGRSPSITISATPSVNAKVQMGGPAPPVTASAYRADPLPNIPTHGYGLRCAGCRNPIVGRIVSAMGKRWHPACFKCDQCGELLEHVSSYENDGKAYCHLDYHERFAPRCFHCKTSIADERFITLDDPALGGQRYYHELHFFCAECGDPFLDPSRSSAAPKQQRQLGADVGQDDDVGFTVYKGHPYCEPCHVRLRMPRCGAGAGLRTVAGVGCGRPIREEAVEALGRKWHRDCFTCSSCRKPFEDPSFFQRGDNAFCDPCYRILVKSEL